MSEIVGSDFERRFENVGVKQTLIFNAFHKRYQFDPQIVTVNEQIADLDITAQSVFD